MTKREKRRIGRVFKRHRTDNLLGLREAARVAGIGYGHLSEIEAGKKVPGLEVALKLCRAYNVSLGTLDL